VIAAVRSENLLSTGMEPSHANGVFDRFGPAVGEEDLRGTVE
jgi:hypothetical protein